MKKYFFSVIKWFFVIAITAFITGFMTRSSDLFFFWVTGKSVLPNEVKALVTHFGATDKGFQGQLVFTNQSRESAIITRIIVSFPHPSESRSAIADWVADENGKHPEPINLKPGEMLTKRIIWHYNHSKFISSNSSFLRKGESGEPCCYLRAVIEFHIIDPSGGKHIVPYSPFRIIVTNKKMGPIIFRSDIIKLIPSPETKRHLL